MSLLDSMFERDRSDDDLDDETDADVDDEDDVDAEIPDDQAEADLNDEVRYSLTADGEALVAA